MHKLPIILILGLHFQFLGIEGEKILRGKQEVGRNFSPQSAHLPFFQPHHPTENVRFFSKSFPFFFISVGQNGEMVNHIEFEIIGQKVT